MENLAENKGKGYIGRLRICRAVRTMVPFWDTRNTRGSVTLGAQNANLMFTTYRGSKILSQGERLSKMRLIRGFRGLIRESRSCISFRIP